MNRYVLLALGFVSLTAAAQPFRSFGAKAGISSARWLEQVYGFEVEQNERRVGLDAGLFIEWLTLPVLSVSTEVHYIQKGNSMEIPLTTEQFPNGTGEVISQNVRHHCLSFSVLPKARLETADLEIYILGGPRIDMTLSDAVDVQGPEPVRGYYAQGIERVVALFRSPRFGLTAGAGIQTKGILPVTVGLEFRFSPDLQDAYTNGITVRNTSMEFLLTIAP
jgi:hypothetical protein